MVKIEFTNSLCQKIQTSVSKCTWIDQVYQIYNSKSLITDFNIYVKFIKWIYIICNLTNEIWSFLIESSYNKYYNYLKKENKKN